MNPTGSKLTRVLHCVASEALPHVYTTSPWSQPGKDKHSFFVRVREVGREAALAEIPADDDNRLFYEQLDTERLPKGGRLELAVAWNSETDTTLVLGENIDRSYRQVARELGIDPDDVAWWFSTLDIGGRIGERTYVGDYKTGYFSAGDPKTAEQLLFGSLALARLYGLDEGTQEFIYLNERGDMRVASATVDDFDDLIPFADRLRALPGRIEKAREKVRLNVVPDLSVGPWCRYCPAKPSCPAMATALVKVMHELPRLAKEGDAEALVLERLRALAPADAGGVYARAKQALGLLESVVESCKEIAKLTPLPLPDGKELAEVETKIPTKVIAEIAEKVLYRDVGVEAALEAIKPGEKSTTLGAISDAVRKRAGRGKGAEAERRIIAAIRAENGLLEGRAPRVREVKKGA